MITVRVYVDRPKPRTLVFDCQRSLDGHTVPRFTRENVAQLYYWLWEFDPEAGPEEGGTTIPYLLDDTHEILGGGVFSVAYPTDHGKSTLVDGDTVMSLIFWPEETLNIIIKRAEEAAIAAVQACAFKLARAAEYFPYAKPMCRWDSRTGLPQVKAGFFIEGCRLRTLGERNRSVFGAGIAAVVVQGMRGRAKLDDLEDENTLKSEAQQDTLSHQVNNAVRNLQREKEGVIPLWAIFGTPQGSNSVMYLVKPAMSAAGVQFKAIHRPRVIQDGPFKGQLLFPATETKMLIQKDLMDPAAFDIAWNLKVPGAGRFDPDSAVANIKDPRLPFFGNENQLTEYLYGRIVEDGQRRVGFEYQDTGELYREASRMVQEDLAIYLGWDPATTGTFALSLVGFLPKTRWLLRLRVDSATSDEQAEQILEWQWLFPSLTVVVERDGTQDSFIDLLRLKDPATMIVPHTTHGFNKNTGRASLPAMMREMLKPNAWHFPWVPEDYCQDYLERVLNEIKHWGPTAHPHGIPSLWFPWFFDRQTRMDPDDDQNRKRPDFESTVEVSDMVISPNRPLRDPLPGQQTQQTPSQESWNRRWPSLRRV